MDKFAFDQKRIAEGYAKDRPYLHPLVVDKMRKDLEITGMFSHGLDVGCGAGLSTRALKQICKAVTGTDISEEMIAMCHVLYPEDGFEFFCSGAETVTAPESTFDIVSAAGMINWIDEEAFLTNLQRIMCDNGLLFIYDFWITDRMAGNDWITDRKARNERYTDWYQNCYLKEFPKPPRKENRWSQEMMPEFVTIEKQTDIELTYEFDLDAFIRFMMIQSNVNVQIENGACTEEEVRQWFYDTLTPIWGEETQTLMFEGYNWYLRVRK